MKAIETSALQELESLVVRHLTGEPVQIPVLAAGEITVVLRWPPTDPQWVCKRLPPSNDRARLLRYADDIERYEALVAERGIVVAPSQRAVITNSIGAHVLYVMQPLYAPDALASAILRSAEPPTVPPVVVQIIEALEQIDDTLGVDGQLSNWAWDEGRATLIDTTTPFLQTGGRSEIDIDVILLPFPAVARPALRRWVAPGVLGRYHRPRDVAVDLLANFHRERLSQWVDPVAEVIGDRFGAPITREEVDEYYRADAKLWTSVQAAKRSQRWWQRTVRRQQYPFLLPERIER